MVQTIIINSINYSGESANILFTPQNTTNVINLGEVTLPYLFESFIISPSLEIYGFYTIYTLTDKCTNYMNVIKPSPPLD